MGRSLRPWQAQALADWRARRPRDYLAVATPGAGKTTFALEVAYGAFSDGLVDQLVVVCPSDHLRRQWADAAAARGLPLDPDFSNSDAVTSPQFLGIAVTYAQVASAPALHEAGVAGRRTFVIIDESHHAGSDMSWGDALAQAYGPATHRLMLSGTPWRSDDAQIPFVTYQPLPQGGCVSVADYEYGYGPALADQVVRPVLFMAYSGSSRWRDSAGAELEAVLDAELPKDMMRRAWRTALDPAGEWISAVLRAADARLSAVRAGGVPDAGGLVLASNQTHAREYARLLEAVCGEPVEVVVSDRADASDRIEAFSASRARWMVAVRMVSEGVDIPRLMVGVYATNVSAALFFAQAVGRFVRARSAAETATVFLPSVPPLLALAAQMEAERRHVVGVPGQQLEEEALMQEALLERDVAEPAKIVALDASGHLDRVIYGGSEHGSAAVAGSAAESSWLTLPGMLAPEELQASLAARAASARSLEGSSWVGSGAQPDADAVPLHRKVSAARRELNRLVGALAHRTGAQHGEVHARLRARSGGPQAAAATLEQLEVRVAAAQDWIAANAERRRSRAS